LHPDTALYQADPLADATIASIVGAWQPVPKTASAAERMLAHAAQWQRIAQVNRLLGQWQGNADLAAWQAPPDTAPDIAAALHTYVQAAQRLPDWADPVKIQRAEVVFMDYGALSCVLLFCASLPECYVLPDLAAVLQDTGQLVQRADYRIRATAAMVFPVMMHGGLTDTSGTGVAQVLKVRLIHAMVRHLILRGSPEAALQSTAAGHIPALADSGQCPCPNLYQTLFARGWDTQDRGLPCNQQELAYTLLTFGYVYLRSLRRLGLGLPPADEEATLHAWNVVGHVLGIQRSLMADSMAQAEALFDRFQAEGRTQRVTPDPRPALAQALMQVMAQAIPWRLVRPFPVLVTGYLCGAPTMQVLGLAGPVAWLSRLAFALCMGLVRGIDTVVRWVFPQFSIARCITRILGYQFMVRLLMDQTRPLKLPQRLLDQVGGMLDRWGDDPHAPRWLNTLEDRFTTRGSWRTPARPV
jgi:hypothetical protein